MRWLSARLGPHAALIPTLAVGAPIAAVLTYFSAEIYEAVTESDGVAAWDHPLLDAAMSVRSPWLDAAVTGYTDIAGTIGIPILALTIMLVWALMRRSWTRVILIATAAAGSLLMTVAGKQLVGRARPPLVDAVPPHEYSPSFTSGHTLNAIVIAGIVAYLLILRRDTVRGRVLTVLVAGIFALTAGLSRIFLGHHWFTDVLAAWRLGAVTGPGDHCPPAVFDRHATYGDCGEHEAGPVMQQRQCAVSVGPSIPASASRQHPLCLPRVRITVRPMVSERNHRRQINSDTGSGERREVQNGAQESSSRR